MKLGRIIAFIPDALKAKFTQACKTMGYSKRYVIEELINGWLKKVERGEIGKTWNK